jgi:hypothetical protein
MRRRLAVSALLAGLALSVPVLPAATDEPKDPNLALKSLIADLEQEEISRVTILHLRYDVLAFHAVSPSDLEGWASTKIDMPLTPDLRSELIDALKRTTIAAYGDQSDLRWGAVFFDNAHQHLHSIYLNSRYFFVGAGRLGYIDGDTVAVNAPLSEWFERNFLPLDER